MRRGLSTRLPDGFLDGFDSLPCVVMNEIFLNLPGEEIPNLQSVSKRWKNLISPRRSRYPRNSISDLNDQFQQWDTYLSHNQPEGNQRWCSHNLASAVPHISIDCLELRIHHINEQFDDLQLSTINTRSVDITFCRPIGSSSTEHIVRLLRNISKNRSIESVRLSSEVAQLPSTIVSEITELFESNRIQLRLDL
ncbi:F-box domain protein [Cooperia oncophora]